MPDRLRRRPRLLGWIGCCIASAAAAAGAPAAASGQAVSADVSALGQWVQRTGDNEGAPYAVIDKKQAMLWLFDGQGRPGGHTPVLLGRARGDASVPGIGERAMASIQPHERTTPAGRFFAEAGRNAAGEDIFWIDYHAAVSMHRLRTVDPAERRAQRLASPGAADNRISYGCINVPAAFYEGRIKPLFAPRPGVVYVLPETMALEALFTPEKQGPGRVPASRP